MTTRATHNKAPRRGRQRGASVLVVLVLLTVMLLAGLSLARFSEVSTLAAGNMAYKEAALQASEAGINTAFSKLTALPDEGADKDKWYLATQIEHDTEGLPKVDWDTMPVVDLPIKSYDVRYVVERMCTDAGAADPQKCLVKQVPQLNSARDDGEEPLDPPAATQFRTTVRVIGPKGTTTFVQSLMTKG